MRSNGSYLGATPTGPTSGAAGVASGIWDLASAHRYSLAGSWPGVAQPPAQVTGLAVDATGDGTLDLSWTAPASDAAITDYSVEYTPSGGSATTVLVGSATTTYQLTSLTNDTEYSVRVAAVSAAGTGAYSAAVTGTPSASDPYFANVSLLLHMDGANGSTTFTDSSSNAVSLTRSGNAQISTAQSKFGGASAVFDGTGDLLKIADDSNLDFGTGDFTLEAWFYISGVANADPEGKRSCAILSSSQDSGVPINGWVLVITGDTTTTGTGLLFRNYVGGSLYDISYSGSISNGEWHHVAVSRLSTNTRIFLDGMQVASGTLGNQNVNSNQNVKVGALLFSTYPWYFNGYIDDLRITKGVARYIASFTPPTAAFPDS